MVQKVGEMLPTGLAFSYLGNIITGKTDNMHLLFIFIYALIFLLVAMFARQQKIR